MKLSWGTQLPTDFQKSGCLFLEPAWLRACANHMQGELHVLTGEGVCIPFELVSLPIRGVPTRVLRVLGDPMADQFFFTQATGLSWSVLIEALGKAPPCDLIVLSELRDPLSEQDAIGRHCVDAGLAPLWRQCGNAPVVHLQRGGKSLEFSDYSSTLRNRLKRGRKKMAAAGEMAVTHHLPKPEQVEDLLSTLKEIEDDSWKGDEDTGLFRADRLEFVRELSSNLAAVGQLEIYVLRLDGTAISYRYGFRHNGRFLDYNLAYRQAFGALSPGRILLEEIVKTSIKEGLDAVDASRGSMIRPHILADWPSEIRPHYRLTLYRPTSRGRLLYILEAHAKPLVQNLRRRFSRS